MNLSFQNNVNIFVQLERPLFKALYMLTQMNMELRQHEWSPLFWLFAVLKHFRNKWPPLFVLVCFTSSLLLFIYITLSCFFFNSPECNELVLCGWTDVHATLRFLPSAEKGDHSFVYPEKCFVVKPPPRHFRPSPESPEKWNTLSEAWMCFPVSHDSAQAFPQFNKQPHHRSQTL